MEYVLFTIIYLLIFFLKGCLYYKVENRKEELIYNITLGDDGIYSLSGSVIEALFYRTDFSNEASVKRFSYQLRQLQIHERLREAGIKNGDTVKILGYEFEFYD